MIGAKWFVGARLNFAENLLRFRDDRQAIMFKGEGLPTVRMTFAQLYDETARLAKSLRDAGVVKGDRVVGYLPNMPHAVVAMLEATSIGAIWSSCSPDFGTKGVLDRFGQIAPKILFTADGYFYNGKNHDSVERIAGIAKELPSVEKLIVIPYVSRTPDLGPYPERCCTRIAYQRKRTLQSSSSSFCLTILRTSCTRPVPPDYQNAWFMEPAARSSSISKNIFSIATSIEKTMSSISLH